MSDRVHVRDLSRHFSFWDRLSDREQQYLLDNTALVTYEKGRRLQGCQRDCLGVLLVKSGLLRTYMLSEEGKEVTLYRLYKGDVCVLSASCILQTITFDVHIDAEMKSQVLQIQADAFSWLAEENVYVENFVYKAATDRFSDVMWAMQQILFMSFDKRLALFLEAESAKTNSQTIHLTHEQVAKYMGSAREVVTRMLKYFANEGIVELSRGGIKIVDQNRLKSLIN